MLMTLSCKKTKWKNQILFVLRLVFNQAQWSEKSQDKQKNIFVTRAVKLQKIVKTPFLTECNDISCSRNIIVVFEERKTCFEMHSMLTIKFFLGRFETDLNERPSTFFPVSLSVDCRGTSSPAKTPCVLNNTVYLVYW